MITDPVKSCICKSTGIQLTVNILAILNMSPLILQADIEFTYIIYKLRIDTVHLVDIGESVATEIYITLCQRACRSLLKSEVLQITDKKNSLPYSLRRAQTFRSD